MLTREEVFQILESVPDPEIPVISLVDLGVVRDVDIRPDGITVTITPTYSGCPAMREMEVDLKSALVKRGVENVEVRTVLTPAWTTEWINPDARERLRRYGIAPPGPVEPQGLITLMRRKRAVACPYCGSHNTRLQSEFGSTACKALHVCDGCQQPFEEFKPI